MLKLSTKTTYAVKAMMDLARSYNNEQPVRLASIAERQSIPLPFLEQIFSKLKKAELVNAVRGPLGGYTLAKNPEHISLVDIVTVLEGPIEPVLCTHPENRSETCHHTDGCSSRHVCFELDGAFTNVLQKNTLAKLCNEADLANQFVTKT